MAESGRMRAIRNRMDITVPWVQIPFSPPNAHRSNLNSCESFFVAKLKGFERVVKKTINDCF